ncbi:hypothetical protein BU23DRAFT_563896 [Bimuria novae-zelandiae CBS 107.79]|uniref:Uncharacterized protein n=1 Tax=Bimuria novae-zelandiae CBS 107.79 TaxID=1447943 RepID=A0A6A5VR55_9PLEO|nr:hypothetical protein BU23DRAFT_563896 [Bimuria novae-zelandiae CBS 107.79]
MCPLCRRQICYLAAFKARQYEEIAAEDETDDVAEDADGGLLHYDAYYWTLMRIYDECTANAARAGRNGFINTVDRIVGAFYSRWGNHARLDLDGQFGGLQAGGGELWLRWFIADRIKMCIGALGYAAGNMPVSMSTFLAWFRDWEAQNMELSEEGDVGSA